MKTVVKNKIVLQYKGIKVININYCMNFSNFKGSNILSEPQIKKIQ